MPPDVHAEHVEETKAAGGGVSTSGPPEGRWGRRVRFGRPSGNAACKQSGPFRQYLLMEIPTDPTPPPAELEFHPAAALFPLLEVESPEFGELIQDIREHGLLQPIVLCDGKILDGRNRYRACQHAGVEPRFEEWSGDSPTAYVLSLNQC